ncbi:MAG: DEAD/DEAH box helicase [Phycisphaerae bacterium]|nr:DEAD/DEAH box helicase [Phycisphaerae bacterium]
MFVLHLSWTKGHLHFWGESSERFTSVAAKAILSKPLATATALAHPVVAHRFAMTCDELRAALESILPDAGSKESSIQALLPAAETGDGPINVPSARLASEPDVAVNPIEPDETLQPTEVPTLELEPLSSMSLLALLPSDHASDDTYDAAEHKAHPWGHEARWWAALGQLARDLLIDQRVIPTVVQERGGTMFAAWRPWLHDQAIHHRYLSLVRSTPAILRAVEGAGTPNAIVEQALGEFIDAWVRRALVQENYAEAIEDRDPNSDPHVAWLAGLLGNQHHVRQPASAETSIVRTARAWIANLEDVGEGRDMRLLLQLLEPPPELLTGADGHEDDHPWRLQFGLVSNDSPPSVLDAEALWNRAAGGSASRARSPQETEKLCDLLLQELGRASRLYPRIEDALEDGAPTGFDMKTAEAYAFLRDTRPLLQEAGIEVLVPDWWGQAASRLGARLLIESEPLGPDGVANAKQRSGIGLHSLVTYSWQIALGDAPLTLEAFQALAKKGMPLARIGGKWVEIRTEDLERAMKFLKQNPGGETTLVQALALAHVDAADGALPVLGLDTRGWVADVFGGEGTTESMVLVEQPERFQGTLRPYQRAGVSWLAFLERYGMGACLADDMGLGKTIQLIALLQHERQTAAEGDRIGPTLLVAPMSVLGNWHRELTRFAPELVVHVHHGLERPQGERFLHLAQRADVVVTTYALVTRDKDLLGQVEWRRVVLDEAQHIKNPPTKQTAAIRALRTRFRVALTGTPVENRLSELWSIMEFCCPGYLGTHNDFRRRFAVPVERHRDKRRADRLRSLVRPFILRRLKTDPKVISDLPPLIETRQQIPLTAEQASLYDQVVTDMLKRVDQAEGIRRRGLVLSALVKLKQICNHPAHFLREGLSTIAEVETDPGDASASAIPDLNDRAIFAKGVPRAARLSDRSGKSIRVLQMLEEVLAAGDRALIFTQYRQMGHLLVQMIRQDLDVDALFLHGGTPQAKREALVARFQSEDKAAPLFILSLKAGGVGLNLTAANHVFHYDRWWNPAVENQATDRAFRIGQLRTVNVHKMISSGTLEERIDQMIEQKTELASQIIGTGEQWLTELSTSQLRDLLSLRRNELEDAP